MKSSSFRSSPAPEAYTAAHERKRVNWDKITYLSILVILVLLLARFVGYEALFVRTDGQFIAGTFDVRFSPDVQVVEFFHTKNHDVEAGAPLFRYVVVEDLEEADRRGPEEELQRREKEFDLVEKIQLKHLDVQKEKETLAYYREHAERIRQGLFLGIYTVDKLEAYERQIAASSADLEALTHELAILRQRLHHVRDVAATSAGHRNFQEITRVYRAPVAGRITEVYPKEWETVTNSGQILSLSTEDSDKLFVRAVLEKGDLRFIREQDVVSIEHANGEKSRGYVHQLFTPTADGSSRSNRQVAALSKYVLADIYPLAQEDRETWTRCKHLGTTITKRKL